MQPGPGKRLTVEKEELRGTSRTVAEIEWLLLILVLLYLAFDGPDPEDRAAVAAGLFFYGAFILGFHYANFYRSESRAKIALETWTMIAFVTWTLWFTGGLASPLVSTYLLVVITSALTLGKLTTLAEVALIAACHVLLSERAPAEWLSVANIGVLLTQLAPLILVAYVTTMFAADIRYGMNRNRLSSETDELTGVYNMRGFAIAADRLFAHAVRHDRPATLLLIDADNLQSVNDTHGRDAGDRLLCVVAKCIEAELRHTDVLARYGEDEFVALLPEASAAGGALDVAERIRKAVTAAPLEYQGRSIAASVSIGLASYEGRGHSIDSVLARADRAMYLAKSQGRNRVVPFKD